MRRSSTIRRRWFGAIAVFGVVIALMTFWFAQLSSSAELTFTCTTPPRSMAQAIEARMHDGRIHVERVQVVEAGDTRYESLFFVSAKVRVAGVSVGIGTWASNVGDFGNGDFRGWARTPTYYTLSPVSDLARAISSKSGVGSLDADMTRPARYSQGCVSGTVGSSR